MRFFRCRICGEACFGTEAPSRCPFCASAHRHLVPPSPSADQAAWIQPTEIERTDLETAMTEAVSAARFFAGVARAAEDAHDGDLASVYARRADIERTHAALLARLAGLPAPEETEPDAPAPASIVGAIAESAERARRAAEHYEASAARATDARVREVLLALAQGQTDLLSIDAAAVELARVHEH